MYVVVKSWWRARYHVYIEGHVEGDLKWQASFLWVDDAWRYVRQQEKRGSY